MAHPPAMSTVLHSARMVANLYTYAHAAKAPRVPGLRARTCVLLRVDRHHVSVPVKGVHRLDVADGGPG